MTPETKKEEGVTDEATTPEEEDEVESKATGEESEEETETTDDPKEKEEHPKKKTKDWPLRLIRVPHANDVLYGRGGGTNHHPGNKRYRKIVEGRKLDYVNSKRLDKPLVALEIIRSWRGQDPPGRFLKLDDSNSTWIDVGDKKAREKTSQALREKAPMIRKQQEEDEEDQDEHDAYFTEETNQEVTKSTRFEAGAHPEQKSGPRRATLARDHSLGREYIAAGQDVTLDGFSWEEPMENIRQVSGLSNYEGRTSSGGPPVDFRTSSQGSVVSAPLLPEGYDPGSAYPRTLSGMSAMSGMSSGALSASEDMRKQFSSGRYESWGPMDAIGNEQMPPPPMPGYGPPGQSSQERFSSYSSQPYTALQREHSLSRNPLRGASATHAAPYDLFGPGRRNSGGWPGGSQPPTAPMPQYGSQGPPPPMAPPPQYSIPPMAPPSQYGMQGPPPSMAPSTQYGSQGPPPSYGPSASDSYPTHQYPHTPTVRDPDQYDQRSGSSTSQSVSPRYAADPTIAKNWSSQSDDYVKAANLIGNIHSEPGDKPTFDLAPQMVSQDSQASTLEKEANNNSSGLSRPGIVKRHTSNQNENIETKKDLVGPSVKRAALNRDNSLASNRLKEKYLPRGTEILDEEVSQMTSSTKEIKLECQQPLPSSRPGPLSDNDRMTTMDMIAMDLMAKPSPLSGANRTSTVDALLEFGDGPMKAEPFVALPSPTRNSSIDNSLDLNRETSVSEFIKDI